MKKPTRTPTNTNQPIHYSSLVRFTTMKTTGVSECGLVGLITPYDGLVTCDKCLALLGQTKPPKSNQKKMWFGFWH